MQIHIYMETLGSQISLSSKNILIRERIYKRGREGKWVNDLMQKNNLLLSLFLKSAKELQVCGNFVSMLMLSFVDAYLHLPWWVFAGLPHLFQLVLFVFQLLGIWYNCNTHCHNSKSFDPVEETTLVTLVVLMLFWLKIPAFNFISQNLRPLVVISRNLRC